LGGFGVRLTDARADMPSLAQGFFGTSRRAKQIPPALRKEIEKIKIAPARQWGQSSGAIIRLLVMPMPASSSFQRDRDRKSRLRRMSQPALGGQVFRKEIKASWLTFNPTY